MIDNGSGSDPSTLASAIDPVAQAPAVSVIVPVFRANADFAVCLDSVARLDPPCLDIVVIVDGGDRDALALARERGARVLSLPVRRGPAAARNAAARAARGDVLFFVDADVALPRQAITLVLGALDAFPGCDAVIGSYDTRPAAPNFLSQYKNLAHHFVHQASREEACTFWSGCGAVRREAFDRAGGFDERYTRPSVEDIELGARLIAAGSRIRLVKSLQATHLKRWTPGALLRSEIFDRAIPWTRLILGAGRMPDDLNLRWSGRVAVLAAALLAASLIASIRWPGLLGATVILAAILVVIDAPLARFLAGARGVAFAALAIPWHWVHYLCSAVGFATGLTLHLVKGRWAPAGSQATTARASGERTCE